MCGRYATTRSTADLTALFEAADETGDGLAPDYNVAPTDPVPIVRISQRVGGRVLSVARWGLVPAWARDTRGAARMINARAETVATSGAFATSFASRRCLVPADGWYEWVRKGDGRKQPYFMTPLDGRGLAFAGIWSVWGDAEQRLMSCSVITTAAVGDLTLVHDRMPLILPAQRWEAWLDCASGDRAAERVTQPTVERLLAPPDPEFVASLELRPVGAAVGDVRNDGPHLLDPVPAPALGDGRDIDADLTLF